MTRQQAQELVDGMPAYLRGLRMKTMLVAFQQDALKEVECPACHGVGRLGPNVWDGCPLCCRQRVVPLAMATWWAEQLSANVVSHRDGLHLAWGHREPPPAIGVTGETPAHVSMPEADVCAAV